MIFFSRAMKSSGIQLRFLVIYKMSIGIQKSTDFDRFFYGMDFVRLFSWKYIYYTLPTIPLKTLRLFILLSRLFLFYRQVEIYYFLPLQLAILFYVLSMFLLRMSEEENWRSCPMQFFVLDLERITSFGNYWWLCHKNSDSIITLKKYYIVHTYSFQFSINFILFILNGNRLYTTLELFRIRISVRQNQKKAIHAFLFFNHHDTWV
jgi:hypothetical protein